MNYISQNQKESCYLCHKTLDIWIKTSIYLDGTEKPIILCYNCAKEIAKDVDKNSTGRETRELLQDVRERHGKSVSMSALKVLALLLFVSMLKEYLQ